MEWIVKIRGEKIGRILNSKGSFIPKKSIVVQKNYICRLIFPNFCQGDRFKRKLCVDLTGLISYKLSLT